MKNYRYAFTMMELVFVIVILGILASVAIPKMSGVKREANIAQGIATVSAIRTGIINERQRSLMKGITSYPDALDSASSSAGESLFDGDILTYSILSSNVSGGWMKENSTKPKYKFIVIKDNESVIFTYTKDDGKFDCDHTKELCKEMIK